MSTFKTPADVMFFTRFRSENNFLLFLWILCARMVSLIVTLLRLPDNRFKTWYGSDADKLIFIENKKIHLSFERNVLLYTALSSCNAPYYQVRKKAYL